jgi:hypothetical protein
MTGLLPSMIHVPFVLKQTSMRPCET